MFSRNEVFISYKVNYCATQYNLLVVGQIEPHLLNVIFFRSSGFKPNVWKDHHTLGADSRWEGVEGFACNSKDMIVRISDNLTIVLA